MGFFTHEAARMIDGRSKYITDTFESVCEDESIEPCSEDMQEAGFDAIIAMNENYNAIMRRTAYVEAAALEETGREYVYTEGVLGDMYNTIKSFLMKIWERIKGLFKRFIMIIDSYSKNDKDFAKKYQKQIFSKSGDTSDFTFKGYKWNIEESVWSPAMDKCTAQSQQAYGGDGNSANYDIDRNDANGTNRYDSTADDYSKKVDTESDDLEVVRGNIYNAFVSNHKASGNTKLTAEEFRKEVHELFRSGESEKEELDNKDLDVHKMYNYLMQSNDTKKSVKRAFDKNKKAIDADIKDLDRKHNENVKDAPGTRTEYTDAELEAEWSKGGGNDIVTNWKASNAKKSGESDEEWKARFKTANKYKETEDEAHKRNDYRSKNLTWFAKRSRITKECLLAIDSELLTAMKERSRQYKACLIAYVHYRPSSESAMTESYLIGKEKNVGGSIFSGISFV